MSGGRTGPRRRGRRSWLSTALAGLALLVSCTPTATEEEPDHQDETRVEAPALDEGEPRDEHDAPATTSAVGYLDASLPVEDRVDDLLERMTLEEKLGQMTQIEIHSVQPGDVTELGLGSVLSGGGGTPDDNTPEAWADMIDGLQEEALATRLGIPILYGVDAVHGHNNVVGATIFPHNIGLGATRDPDLVREIGRATGVEMLATGAHWNFAPVLAVPQDIRWGRTYEAYSDDVEVVSELSVAFLEGLQSVEGPPNVIGTPKHFVADGAAEWGTSRHPDGWMIDQGDASIGEQELRAVHLPPYEAAIEAGARTIMGSFSSWQGEKVHGREDVMTGMLRDELGFDGLLLSDWAAVDQIDPDYTTSVVMAVDAGIDMNMVPHDARTWMSTLQRVVEAGDVSTERIDEAVRRILRVKFEIGLFEQPFAHRDLLDRVGSDEHRALARRAVAASLVPLVGRDTLPLADDVGSVLVTGESGNDIGAQSGGWTITWQGRSGPITPGTSILDALEERLDAEVVLNRFGRADERFDVGIAVVGERPYAEGVGDDPEPSLTEEDLQVVARTREQVDTLVVVVISGRPILLHDVPEIAEVVVAAWLPGTEGAGVVDGLFGEVELTGTLPMGWPDSPDQIGPDGDEPWLPRGWPNG